MTARLVLPGTASQDDWLKARRDGITASEIAVILGLSPYSSPYALYWQKLGQLPQQDDSLSLALGRHLESFVCDRFAELRPGLHVAEEGFANWLFANSDRPWQMATPDRLLYDWEPGEVTGSTRSPLAVLEAKTSASYDGWGDDGTDEIPVHYRCQVLWQMDVMGVTTGYVAALFLHSRRLRVYELTMDGQANADLELMRKEAYAFRQRILFARVPDIDWRPATADALRHLHPSVEDTSVLIGTQLAGRYMAACRNHKAAEQKKRLYENHIRALLGSGHRAVDQVGQVIARRDVYDVKEHVRKASHVDKLVPVKPKEVTP